MFALNAYASFRSVILYLAWTLGTMQFSEENLFKKYLTVCRGVSPRHVNVLRGGKNRVVEIH